MLQAPIRNRARAASLTGFALLFLAAPLVETRGHRLAPAVDGATPSPPPSTVPASPNVPSDDPDALSEALRNRLEAGLAGAELSAAGRRIFAREALTGFYGSRAYEPVWLDEGRPSALAATLVREIREVELDGLDPEHYHLVSLDSILSRIEGEGRPVPTDDDAALRRKVDAELLLTDAFLLLGSHLLLGRVNPETRDPEWRANRRGADLAAVLEDALGTGDVAGALAGLRPQEETYHGLRQALDRYRATAAAGGWEAVSAGPLMELGSHGPRVAALRSRLIATGDLQDEPARSPDAEAFDEAMDEGVRRFQGRHGLVVDGRVGPATLRALNVPVEQRIAQIEVNLERWRWMPTELGERYFLVNIPAFRVELWEDGTRIRSLRAVVGRAYRRTPVFFGTMTYLVLAPHWHVPPGIAANDQLPRIREDPDYVASQRMVLLEQATNRPVDPHSVDWSGMTGPEFNRRFRLRQDPGPHNALGDVKLMFPNRFNVYLHDTPGRDLFDQAARDFSSGCIRIESALEIAAHLLRENPAWDLSRVQQVVRAGREQYVTLPTPYQVHLQYWTAWLEDDGRVQFREDIYQRDPAVRTALDRSAPPI